MHYNKIDSKDLKIPLKEIKALLELISSNKITDKVSKKIIEELFIKSFDVKAYVKENNLELIKDNSLIEDLCKEVISENPKAVEELKQGNQKSLNFLVGQVMRKSKGKADPKEVNKIIRELAGV